MPNLALISFVSIQERKTFIGSFVNGKRDGRGKMVWKNGEEYDGDWKDNLQVCGLTDVCLKARSD